MKKLTGWVYVETGMLPAVDKSTWEVSWSGLNDRDYVVRAVFRGGKWLTASTGQDITPGVYAYRSVPEPAPRRKA